jgi:phage tail sheath gpL-like
MPINTGVSPTLRRPQTFHSFTYQYATRALIPLPLRIALIGTMLASGATAVAGTVYEVSDSGQTDGLFGESSELALMCRKAMETGALLQRGPRIFAVPVAEPGGGTANVKTITVTGTATADGTAIIRVAGRTVTVGIRTGDVQNTVAAAIYAALRTVQATLPVIVTTAGANVVTLTHATKGINGTDVAVSIEQSVAGSALAVANTVVGAGVADHQTAIDALAALPMDGIAFANHAAADITEINTDIASRWGYAEKRWRYYFLGESGSIGTATALATAANHQAVVIGSFEGCLNTTGEIATALCFAAFSRDRPNANFDGVKLPLYPPAAATIYTPTEVETAIAAGLTPLTAEIDPFSRAVSTNVARIERLITTKTTQNSQPFEVLRDFAVSRTGVYVAQQLDAAYAARFQGDANPDGTLATDDVVDQVRDMVEGILRTMQENQMLRNVDVDLARLVVERDETAIGRFNVDVAYTVVVGLHQIAYVHRVQV